MRPANVRSLIKPDRIADNSSNAIDGKNVENERNISYHAGMGIDLGGAIMDADLVTTSAIARLLHVSEATVRSYAEADLIPCVRTFGGHRRFNPGDVLEAWAHHGGVEAAHDPAKEMEDEKMQPIEISAAWKNEWAITGIATDDSEDEESDVFEAEPFPGVRGKTRFVVSRRLVGV